MIHKTRVAVRTILPGFLIAVLVSVGAIALQKTELFTHAIPLSPLIIAILIGFAIRNSLTLPGRTHAGIKFSSKKVLRLAIIFLGFRLSFAEIAGIGMHALVVIVIASTATILFTVWLGGRMGIPTKRSLLLGSGISICGASAVAAVDGVIKAKEEDTAFAIGAITLLGTVFMVAYPFIYRFFGLHDTPYAIWSGASIHEVAQVTAAGSAMADQTAQALASSVKMIRVLFIIPFTFVLLFFPWHDADEKTAGKGKIAVPWFAVFFFVSVVINSLGIIPANITSAIVAVDTWGMTVAMAALGLDISVKSMMSIGKNAFILGIVSSLLIAVLSAVLVWAV